MTAGTEEGSHKLPAGFDKAQAKAAIEALMKHDAKRKADSLFPDAPTRFLLDIQSFKTPSGFHEFFNIILPNSPFPDPESLDIMLVVKDKKEREAEHIVGEIKDLLLISNKSDELKVGQIMTLQQLKDEFSTFEAKRALAKSVDIVIAENEVFKALPTVLGREFYRKKKFPLGIPGRGFKDYDLGEQILYALNKTTLHISLKGQTSTVVIGHDNIDADGLTENVSKIANWLKLKFPGGWSNIQKLSIQIGTDGIPPLVIYFSTDSVNDVKKPAVVKGGSIPDPITGDLSTLLGKRVRVNPGGQIDIMDDVKLSKEDKELIKNLELPKETRKNKNKKNEAEVGKKEEPEEVKDEMETEVVDEADVKSESDEDDDEDADAKSEEDDEEAEDEEDEEDEEMVKESDDDEEEDSDVEED